MHIGEETELAHLREVVGLWYVDHATAADIVYAACDLLVVGLDGPSLRALAAVPVGRAHTEITAHLEPALADVGVSHHAFNSAASLQAGLLAMASRTLSGAYPPRYLAAWAHQTFGHQVDSAAELARLDDVYDVGDGTNRTPEDIDADVLAEAQRIVAFSQQS